MIIGSPTYEMSPTVRYKTVCDRIGPSHDITFRKSAFEEMQDMVARGLEILGNSHIEGYPNVSDEWLMKF